MNTQLANSYHFYRDYITQFASFLDQCANSIFRKIELSISDRTFLFKDLDDKLKLPALYIQFTTLQSRPEKNNPLYLNSIHGNASSFTVPILYNETLDEYILALLQHNYLSIDITINASSQLELLEILQFYNQIFQPNIYFKFNFTTLIPINDNLVLNWNYNNHNIYYLYEQKITDRIDDKIVDKSIWYALVQMNSLVQTNTVTGQVTNYIDNQTGNISFTAQIMTPIILYKNTNPKNIQNLQVVLSNSFTPISSHSYDLINQLTKKSDYKFVKGIIIDKNILQYDSNTNNYYITIDNIDTSKLNSYIFIFIFDSSNILSTATHDNFKIEVINTTTVKIEFINLTSELIQKLSEVKEGTRIIDCLIYSCE